MNEISIAKYITDTFPGVEIAENLGYTFFFCGADRKLPFATIATADNEYDRVSKLDRPSVFRLNIGVSKQTFQTLFGTEKVDLGGYDFAALDKIMPHPDYARQFFCACLIRATRRLSECGRCLQRLLVWQSAGRRSGRFRDD